MASEINTVISEQVKVIATEQIESTHQYFKVREVRECECSSRVALLEKELTDSKETVNF